MRHRHAQTGYENIVDNVKTVKKSRDHHKL